MLDQRFRVIAEIRSNGNGCECLTFGPPARTTMSGQADVGTFLPASEALSSLSEVELSERFDRAIGKLFGEP